MIDRIGLGSAVLATMVVAGEDRPARECRSPVVRNLHHVEQPDHEGIRDRQTLGANEGSVVFDDLGLVVEDEARGATSRNDARRGLAPLTKQQICAPVSSLMVW